MVKKTKAKANLAKANISAPETKYQDLDLSIWDNLVKLFKNVQNHDQLTECFSKHIQKIIDDSKLDDYQVRFLFDRDSISEWTQNRLYDSFKSLDSSKKLLLIIDSRGGSVEPAYLISKSAKKLSKSFVVAVPRKAKSAATLICLGADEVHMGLVSHLGPIDPQVDDLPALGVSNAIEGIAAICERHPKSSEMFAKYLSMNVEPAMFGYFERIAESSVQYAERLLNGKKLPPSKDKSVGEKLVYEYKDHGFVIDYDEAKELLGEEIVKTSTPEFKLAEKIYEFWDDISMLMEIFKRRKIYMVGECEKLSSNELKK